MPRKKSQANEKEKVQNSEQLERSIVERCPYCESKDFVKRGTRKNKYQDIQLYLCRNPECERTFTARTIKGKQFPWPMVLDAISYYNLGYSFEQCSKILEAKFYCPAAEVESSSRSNAEVEEERATSADKDDSTAGNVGSGPDSTSAESSAEKSGNFRKREGAGSQANNHSQNRQRAVQFARVIHF